MRVGDRENKALFYKKEVGEYRKNWRETKKIKTFFY